MSILFKEKNNLIWLYIYERKFEKHKGKTASD